VCKFSSLDLSVPFYTTVAVSFLLYHFYPFFVLTFGYGVRKTCRKSEPPLYFRDISYPAFGGPHCQSRASSDGGWVHDRVPGAPKAATQPSDSNAPLTNKIMVTNLHYEITPKDLTVCSIPLLPHSRLMSFVPPGGNFWTSRHARARAIHQGTEVRLPLPRLVVEEKPSTFSLLHSRILFC
jgi:hypothetical protein